MRAFLPAAAVALLFLAGGCEKDGPSTPDIPLILELEHWADDEPLVMDTMQYTNEAGNDLSVSRLTYFLSGWEMMNASGEVISWDAMNLVDIEHEEDLMIQCPAVPPGTYQLRCMVGIGPMMNHHDSLRRTVRVNEMIWPMMMGGGWHFMKLEGHFRNSQGIRDGYTMHLGTDGFACQQEWSEPFLVDMQQPRIKLRMNVMEWFKNPEVYDLNQGNYSMGDSALMGKLTRNGDDVFQVHP